MKIEKSSNPLPATPVGDAGKRTATSGASSSQAAVSSESGTSVHLGSTSARLRSMEAAAASTRPVNTQKIAEIKQAISEGRFQVNSSVVADRLLNTVRDLIKTSSR